MSKKVVYFICNNKGIDGHVSKLVLENLKKRNLEEADIIFDGYDVLKYVDDKDNIYYFTETNKPICYCYDELLDDMNKYFSDCDMSGMVTWHEGASAPPNVLTVHSLGDVNEGIYGPTNVRCMHNLLYAYERNRVKYGLDEYSVVTEATHWSGCYDDSKKAKALVKFPVPMVDIEIGSDPSSWENETAVNALTDTLFEVFNDDDMKIHNILCVGGMHFDPDFAKAVFTTWNDGKDTFGVTHIIANQWLVTGEYIGDHGIEYMDNAIKAIGDVEAITYHDNTKGCYKDVIRALGQKYNIPVFKHQKLRKPEELELKK